MKELEHGNLQHTSIFGDSHPDQICGPHIRVTPRFVSFIAAINAWPGTVEQLTGKLADSGVDLPGSPGQSLRSTNGFVAHNQGPGRWLVEHVDHQMLDIPIEIGTVTVLDHARSCFAFEGDAAVELAQKLAPIDFSLDRHGPMSFIQSGSDHSTSFALWRETETRFVAYVERSFGRDFWQVLEAECAEFLGDGNWS